MSATKKANKVIGINRLEESEISEEQKVLFESTFNKFLKVLTSLFLYVTTSSFGIKISKTNTPTSSMLVSSKYSFESTSIILDTLLNCFLK